MTEKNRELNRMLIRLLDGLGQNRVRITAIMAMITACHLQQEMVDWIATFYGKEDTLTIQAFMSKLEELTDTTETE